MSALDRWKVLGMIVLAFSLLINGCAKNEEQEVLTVFAASSLTESFREIARAFQALHPGVKVQLNFAGSQVLMQQLSAGAQADVFASADERYVAEAVEQNLAEQPRLMAKNRLVAVIAKEQAGIENLGDLVKIKNLVLADPRVPVGAYSEQVLDNLGRLYGSQYKSRVIENVVSWESNVKQVVAKVALGEAGGALVYATDVTPDLKKQVKVLEIPPEYNVEAKYFIAVGKNGKQKELAAEFIDFLMSSRGQEILLQFGFLPIR
ncbi:molybdate ABC transporter substrate-binding protein [Calderihabitans maritimus]|nr:molybdate ABC transporter substrate-binding protein [Calderihabitans maritimus]